MPRSSRVLQLELAQRAAHLLEALLDLEQTRSRARLDQLPAAARHGRHDPEEDAATVMRLLRLGTPVAHVEGVADDPAPGRSSVSRRGRRRRLISGSR